MIDFSGYLFPGQAIQLIGEKPRRIIIEIGANDGKDTVEMLKHLNASDKIYAIEADPRCIEKHKNHINNPICQLTHAAVTNLDGEGIFHLCTSHFNDYGVWDCASSLKKIKHGLVVNPWLRYEQDVNVRYLTLNTFAQESCIDYVDFIWCDVEGAYGEVVDGGKEILKKTKFFYTECEDVETYEGEIMYPALKFKMEELGWELVHRFQYDALFVNKALIHE